MEFQVQSWYPSENDEKWSRKKYFEISRTVLIIATNRMMKCTKDIDKSSNLGFPRLVKHHQNFLKFTARKNIHKLQNLGPMSEDRYPMLYCTTFFV